MITEYWTCANILIKRHGWQDAFLYAMERAIIEYDRQPERPSDVN